MKKKTNIAKWLKILTAIYFGLAILGTAIISFMLPEGMWVGLAGYTALAVLTTVYVFKERKWAYALLMLIAAVDGIGKFVMAMQLDRVKIPLVQIVILILAIQAWKQKR